MTSDSKTETTSSDDVTPESTPADAASANAQTADAEPATAATTEAAGAEQTDAPGTDNTDNTDADTPATDNTAEVPAATRPRTAGTAGGGVAAGAAAIVSAALGLVSITGSSLGDMLRFRKEIVGQIDMRSGGGGGDQVEVAYGAPWDTVAIVNGAFALLAVIVGGALLAVHANNADTKSWVKAVALAGALLGVVGLGIAGGMYLDLFASQPVLPQAPAMPGAGG